MWNTTVDLWNTEIWRWQICLFSGKEYSKCYKNQIRKIHIFSKRQETILDWLDTNCISSNILCCHFSHVWLFATLWTVALQAPLSMEFSRQEYWSGLPCPSPEDLSDPGIKLASPMSPALAGRFFTTSATWEAQVVS